jgi:hypothetical protein
MKIEPAGEPSRYTMWRASVVIFVEREIKTFCWRGVSKRRTTAPPGLCPKRTALRDGPVSLTAVRLT